jgi:hypothetical protein
MNNTAEYGLTMEQAEKLILEINPQKVNDFREFMSRKTVSIIDEKQVVYYTDVAFFLSLIKKTQFTGVVHRQENRF